MMFKSSSGLFSLGIIAAAIATNPCRAEVILGPAPTGTISSYYNRFAGGFPDTPSTTVNNPTFYQPTLDLSGVGWKLPGFFGAGGGNAWSVAMIDDRHFIGAWHTANNPIPAERALNVGDTLNFRPFGTSSLMSRTISNLQQVFNASNQPTDLMLGTLSTPFLPTDGIRAYTIPSTVTPQQELYIYGRESRLGRNNVSQLITANVGSGDTVCLIYDYDQPGGNPDGQPSTVGPDEAHTEPGDSGSPLFVLIGGQLQLVGTHSGIGSYQDFGLQNPPGVTDLIAYSLDVYVPFYSAQIAALIAVPEPSSFALITIVGIGAAIRYRRGRRQSRPA